MSLSSTRCDQEIVESRWRMGNVKIEGGAGRRRAAPSSRLCRGPPRSSGCNFGGRGGCFRPPGAFHSAAKISRHGRGAKKWLNFEKNCRGACKKKKNASVNISETSRAAHLYVPPAPCHVPLRALKIRRRLAAPKSAGRSAAC